MLNQDAISYGAAITACEKDGEWLSHLERLKEMRMQQSELNPDVISYGAVLSAGEKGTECCHCCFS